MVEAGIGARLDPTRACRAAATCVTSIELEHAERLGPAITDIAREKAAVARAGVPLVIGPIPEIARKIVELEAARIGAPLLRLGRDITVRHRARPAPAGSPPTGEPECRAGRGWTAVRTGALTGSGEAEIAFPDRTIPLALRQPGRHMLENAALALALAREVGALRRLDDATASAALESTVLPGRAEVLQQTPLVIADGAHTRASIEVLVRMLDDLRPSTLVAVVSVTRGKDAARMLSTLVRQVDTVIATAAEPSRSLPAQALAARSAKFEDAHFDREHGRTGRCAVDGGASRRARRARVRDRLDVHGGGGTPHSPARKATTRPGRPSGLPRPWRRRKAPACTGVDGPRLNFDSKPVSLPRRHRYQSCASLRRRRFAAPWLRHDEDQLYTAASAASSISSRS